MRATQNAPRGPCRLLECCYGLAEIGERGTGVFVKRIRVKPPHGECESIAFSARASATTVEAFFSASISSLTPAEEELMVESVAKLRGAGSSAAASKFVVSQ